MPLVSIQISVGARVLKPWGIVCVVAIATLWDLYVGVRDGSIGGASSSFTFPPELWDQPVSCNVAMQITVSAAGFKEEESVIHDSLKFILLLYVYFLLMLSCGFLGISPLIN